MAATERRVRATDKPAWSDAAQALFRAAQVVAHSGGPALFDTLVRELADILQAPAVFIAVFGNESRRDMCTLAAVLDGAPLRNFEYPLEGSPCEKVVGRAFRYVPRGVAAEFPPGTLFGAKGMDAYAAFPLNDSGGNPLGLLAAMGRRPIADETLAEALLKIFAGRIVAEIERSRADGALRAAALAVSSAHGETVFAELARYLATILQVEMAFIARHEPDGVPDMRMMSVYLDGTWLPQGRYPLESSPCAHVLGQRFRAYPSRLRELFPDDCDAQMLGLESYAGFPLTDRQGRALGTVGVSSRRPLAQVERIESMLQIFAVRAAAELEQLRAHEALSRSEASYRAIFESAEDAIFIHEWDTGEVLDVNPKACATFGYDHDELCRLSLADISSGVPPYTAEQATAYFRLAKLDRCPPFEWHRRNKDGSLHWDEVRLKPVVIDGRPHILAFTREITAQKQALEALLASEEQHRSIFNASVDGLLLKNAEDEIVDVNEAYLRMHGYQRDELIGRPHGDLIPADQRAACDALVPRIVAGEGCHVEARTQRRDGTVFDVEIHGVNVQYRGRPLALIVMRDITERKAAEAQLRASEEQYRAIFNASADALILWNSRHRRVDVNPAYERIYGRTRDEVIGRGYDDPQFPAEYAGPRRELVRRALAGEACSAVLEALRSDGARIVTEVHAIPISHRGEPHVLAIARDITERRQNEMQRAALERQLLQAQKMEAIGQLTGGIAHDFNNILTSVIGYLVLGHERAEMLGDATLVRQLGQAQLAAQRARDLIAQMMTFARRQPGERRVLPLAPLLRQTAQLLRATLPSSIVLDVTEVSVGTEDATPPVQADAVQLEQVLFNLCINARDALDGAGHIRVGLRQAVGSGRRCASCGLPVERGPWVELSVADSGAGIPADVQARMFEPFFSTKEVGRGSGMGLAMVHGIVHDHLGHVSVDTQPGQGTTFRILLPAAATPACDAATALPAAAGAPGPLAGRVLLVEDEAMVGDFMAELLQGWGLQVVLKRSAPAARRWLEDASNALDLLITDQTMPQLTGLALAQHASTLRPGLPILLYTGQADTLEPAELQAHGVRALLRKPVDAEALRTLLRRWLDGPHR